MARLACDRSTGEPDMLLLASKRTHGCNLGSRHLAAATAGLLSCSEFAVCWLLVLAAAAVDQVSDKILACAAASCTSAIALNTTNGLPWDASDNDKLQEHAACDTSSRHLYGQRPLGCHAATM